MQDIETFDLEDFKYNFVNITAFRLVDADDVGVRGILRDMEKFQSDGNNLLNKSRVIQVSFYNIHTHIYNIISLDIYIFY